MARLKEVVRRSPGNVRFLLNLARAQLRNREGEAAIATYRQAIRENPRRRESHIELATAYRQLGREAEAKKEDEIVLKLLPSSETAE